MSVSAGMHGVSADTPLDVIASDDVATKARLMQLRGAAANLNSALASFRLGQDVVAAHAEAQTKLEEAETALEEARAVLEAAKAQAKEIMETAAEAMTAALAGVDDIDTFAAALAKLKPLIRTPASA